MTKPIQFSCCSGRLSKTSQLCTKAWFLSQLNSAEVAEKVRKYREEGDEQAKGSLPAILPHSWIADGSRFDASCQPSGLVALDIDNHNGEFDFDPREFFRTHIEPKLQGELSNVVLVQVTASGHGLRVIAKRQKQQALLDEGVELFTKMQGDLPFHTLDTSCFNPARIFFLTTLADTLYLKSYELFGGQTDPGFDSDQPVPEARFVPESKKNAVKADAPMVTTLPADPMAQLPVSPEVLDKISADGAYYDEVPYSEIVDNLIRAKRMDLHKGNRNNTIYRLACLLRTLCRSEKHLCDVLPFCGLSDDEVASTVHSACSKMKEGELIDATLKHVIDRLQPDQDTAIEAVEPPMPTRLPKAMKEILEPFPATHRAAMAISALPMLGALATRLRMKFLNDEVHSPSFISLLIAEQGTGKSSMMKLQRTLLSDILAQDEKARKAKDEWRDAKEAAGENAAGPRPPHLPIRNVNPECTFPALVEMLKDAKGQHLIICAPEIDSVPTNGWFQNGTTLRKAYDNEMGGQDTKSAKAVSGYVPFMCNIAMSGTPTAVFRHFKNAEDGSVSRCIPSTFGLKRGQNRIPDKARTPANLKAIEDIKQLLQSYGSTPEEQQPVSLPKIEKAMLKFYESKGDLYNMTMKEGIESFRTRATVDGFRAGAVMWLLEGKRETKAAIAFALWVAEYKLYYLMKFFGKKVEEAVADNQEVFKSKAFTSNDMIFASLPDDFDNAAMAALFQQAGRRGSGVSQTGKRWEENHWVVRVARGRWQKTQLGKERAEWLSQSVQFPSAGMSQIADDTLSDGAAS